jgi:Ca2+/H+ antiporter, TMEM165/GDT1 family
MTQFWAVLTAAFLASLVEAVEALTIVLAVATVRGWRPAGLGALAGLALLVFIVVALGPLLDHVPLHLLQLVIGVLLMRLWASFFDTFDCLRFDRGAVKSNAAP